VGIVTVIMRSVLERRRELALMAATGFSGPQLARLLLLEHGGLLVAGLAVGTTAALVAVAPQLRQAQAAVNWPALLATLLAVLIVGLGSSVLAVRAALRGSLLEALRSE
jgi:ABC-type antimicrobial peptide transport system permease subunit